MLANHQLWTYNTGGRQIHHSHVLKRKLPAPGFILLFKKKKQGNCLLRDIFLALCSFQRQSVLLQKSARISQLQLPLPVGGTLAREEGGLWAGPDCAARAGPPWTNACHALSLHCLLWDPGKVLLASQAMGGLSPWEDLEHGRQLYKVRQGDG